MTKRHVWAGGAGMLAFIALYQALTLAFPDGSFARTAVSNIGYVLLEAAVLGLFIAAFWATKGNVDRWVWLWMASWIFFNLAADGLWAFYELRGVEVPSPGATDVLYLGSYLIAFAGVLVFATKSFGTLRAFETTIDATMFTIGAAGLAWPLVLGPMLSGTSGAEFWLTLAYPIGDLLFILAFASLFLGCVSSKQRRLRPYIQVICLAFLFQLAADGGYFISTATGGEYGPGSWMDAVWLLCFATTGVAALMAMRAARGTAAELATDPTQRAIVRPTLVTSYSRILVPYISLPIIASMLAMQISDGGWRWDSETRVLVYLGLALVLLLVFRQYVILSQNHRLNASLSRTSGELEDKLGDLANLNERLEILNHRAHHINSLQTLQEVADAGLELACLFEQSPGGWISLFDKDGAESTIARRGAVDHAGPADPNALSAKMRCGLVRSVSLDFRGLSLGTLYLLTPEGDGRSPDLLPVIAAHVATAIDNAQRYQDALNLAERDPLTGLYNHRGIHKRLAGETLRAQQSGTELSLIMMDIDDFKLLNDTFGHPVGDAVLRQVSEAIRGVLRHADLAGRVGGDELLLVLPNTGAEGAFQLSERLRETMQNAPYTTEAGLSVPLYVSLGVATFPTDAQSLGQLVETADANLYESKQRGGNTTTGSPIDDNTRIEAGGLLGVAGRLLNVVGARDHYTRRHSEQVALHALSLGEAVRLSDESLRTLHVAAMLHDVGKIAVPSDLLRKPTPLSAAEEDMMRRHVDVSAAVIRDMPRLAEIADVVRAHHERHDGAGYPAEAAGDEIPLLARILAVADAYSAMTVDRPYRKSLMPHEARAELQKAAGTQLDPELVRVFLGLLDARDAPAACAEAV